jgi:hypothetical protein
MAGGRETPRQKMIGMMYLVLTALLALNVAKEIVAAFVTLNDKLEVSSSFLQSNSLGSYTEFDKKRAALKAVKGDMATLNLWQGKAEELQKRTQSIVSYILGESNTIIKTSEGKDWIHEKDDKGNILSLKPLNDIAAMDNYDIPTNHFIGGNPRSPKSEGRALRDSIHAYRDYVSELMGNYKEGANTYTFIAPATPLGLTEALRNSNPIDTNKIAQFYRQLTLPEEKQIKDGSSMITLPWVSAMFDHAPIVAACAILTSLKLDISNAESLAAEYMLEKVKAPIFNFNKIEPLAFARTSYLNKGDSMLLKVMVAAYDSTEIVQIRYGINEDTLPERWKTLDGAVSLKADKPGDYRVKGQIGVRERGDIAWKDWSYNYKVGEPTANISLPSMNVLYRDFDNEVVGGATGYSSMRIVAKRNARLEQVNGKTIAKPGSDRETVLAVQGIAEDGSSAELGTFTFRVKNLPAPKIRLGAVWEESGISSAQLGATNKVFASYTPDDPIDLNYDVVEYEITVQGAPRPVKVSGSTITPDAKRLLRQAPRGSKITLTVLVKNPKSGRTRKRIATFIVT